MCLYKLAVRDFVTISHSLCKRRFNDFGFRGPPTPVGQGLCGFNKGRS